MSPPGEVKSRRTLFTILAFVCFLFIAWQLLEYFIFPTPTKKTTPVTDPRTPSENVCNPNEPIKKVAIIGAGSGGASTAYFLSHFKSPCQRLNITIYERNYYVGGRSTTVNVLDDPEIPVELGASIFVEVNRNLVSAARSMGLTLTDYGGEKLEGVSRGLSVWDGEKLVFSQYDESYQWWNTFKILWTYGMSPIRTNNLMKKTVGKFLKLYDDEFPFRSLSNVADRVGLQEAISTPGAVMLMQNSISKRFANDIIQASTRVNYAQNLDQIHGLETMVCMATDGAMSVKGGNWQIFDGMIKASGALLVLNTTVERITKQDELYNIRAYSGSHCGKNSDGPSYSDDFDVVVMAAPLHLSNITIAPSPVNLPKPIDYVNLHVTLFTSPLKIKSLMPHLVAENDVPSTLLTTLPSPESPYVAPDFYSISTLRSITNKQVSPPRMEYVYKIFSPQHMDPQYIQDLLVEIPEVLKDDETGITWKYAKVWQSYPYLPPRTDFDELQLDGDDGNLWYTSGIESFISTMETSSLMGMNVAKLISQKWGEKSAASDETVERQLVMEL